MKTKLEEMSWQEVESFLKDDRSPILIPVGSIEQHGYHLPLGTDSMVAIGLANDAATLTQTMVTPPLWFGWSPHHLALPGSVSIRAEVLIELAYDVLESLSLHGAKKFIIINGHRIVNIPWLQIASERAKRKLGVQIAIFDPAYMIKEIAEKLGFGEIGHAEEIETSHALHLFRELVHMEKAQDYVHRKKVHYHIDPRISNDTLCYIPMTAKELKAISGKSGGTTGRPSLASADKGKILHDHLIKRLVEVIEEFRTIG
jgi:creatinine amidohydrolase